MGNSNTVNGLKLLFCAAAVNIAVTILGIFGIFGSNSFISTICSIASIVSGLATIAGVYIAGKDNDGYAKAFLYSVISLGVSFVGSLLLSLFWNLTIIGPLLSLVLPIITLAINLLVKFNIINATISIHRRNGAHALAESGITLWRITLICTAAGIVLSLFTGIQAVGSVFNLLRIATDLVGNALYLLFLFKSFNSIEGKSF